MVAAAHVSDMLRHRAFIRWSVRVTNLDTYLLFRLAEFFADANSWTKIFFNVYNLLTHFFRCRLVLHRCVYL